MSQLFLSPWAAVHFLPVSVTIIHSTCVPGAGSMVASRSVAYEVAGSTQTYCPLPSEIVILWSVLLVTLSSVAAKARAGIKVAATPRIMIIFFHGRPLCFTPLGFLRPGQNRQTTGALPRFDATAPRYHERLTITRSASIFRSELIPASRYRPISNRSREQKAIQAREIGKW